MTNKIELIEIIGNDVIDEIARNNFIIRFNQVIPYSVNKKELDNLTKLMEDLDKESDKISEGLYLKLCSLFSINFEYYNNIRNSYCSELNIDE